RSNAGSGESGRDLADDDRAVAEGLKHQSGTGKEIGSAGQPLDRSAIEVDHCGDEQGLGRDATPFKLALHPLIDEALMSGMLVDDDDAIAGLRQNVVLM